MLSQKGYGVEVFLFNISGRLSEECQINLDRLKECGEVYFSEITTQFSPPVLTSTDLVVDGLFGSGLNHPRAAGVLENTQISLTGEDPIARNVAGRIWNLATATSDKSCLDLIDNVELARDDTIVIVLASSPLPKRSKMANIVMDDIKTLPQRLRTACESFRKSTPIVRIELPLGLNYDGTFTTGDAQTFAVTVLDAICTAFDR